MVIKKKSDHDQPQEAEQTSSVVKKVVDCSGKHCPQRSPVAVRKKRMPWRASI